MLLYKFSKYFMTVEEPFGTTIKQKRVLLFHSTVIPAVAPAGDAVIEVTDKAGTNSSPQNTVKADELNMKRSVRTLASMKL